MTDEGSTLREEAAGWFAKMRGEDADLHRAEFERWLARGALHRAAYNRVGEVFAAAKVLKSEAAAGEGGLSNSRRRFSVAALVLAATAGLVLTYTGGSQPFFGGGPVAKRSVQISQSARQLELGTGARALLDIDGLVTTGVQDRVHVARLAKGRIRLTVLPDGADHALLAGAVALHSNGGTFDLWLRSDRSLSTQVLSGTARLVPAALGKEAAGASRSVLLAAGETCLTDPSGQSAKVAGSSGTDWPDGILEFRGARLDDVLEEANRYSAIKIRLADPSLAKRRLTGRIAIADASRLARQIAAALSVEIDERHPGTIFLRSRE